MNRLTQYLTFAGALPFALALIMEGMQWQWGQLHGAVIFHTYSAIILSFMAGSLWGQASHFTSSQHNPLLLISNLWALLAWFGLLLPPHFIWLALIINVLGFTHLLWIERRFKSASAPLSYYSLRKSISWIVIVLHLAMLLLHLRGFIS